MTLQVKKEYVVTIFVEGECHADQTDCILRSCVKDRLTGSIRTRHGARSKVKMRAFVEDKPAPIEQRVTDLEQMVSALQDEVRENA